MFIKLFMMEEKETITYIENIKKSIVIIIPEKELISYNNNPKWLYKDYKSSWIWAWFFISSDWKIQTVNHIVENDKLNYKIIHNNIEYNSKVISRNSKQDLAILKINTELKLPFLEKWISNINENIYSFWIDINNFNILYNTWILINKKSKLDDESNLLEISNILKPGFSGWPIINKKWKVIWINYAISEWKNYWINF